jgi:hypothetical protein
LLRSRRFADLPNRFEEINDHENYDPHKWYRDELQNSSQNKNIPSGCSGNMAFVGVASRCFLLSRALARFGSGGACSRIGGMAGHNAAVFAFEGGVMGVQYGVLPIFTAGCPAGENAGFANAGLCRVRAL